MATISPPSSSRLFSHRSCASASAGGAEHSQEELVVNCDLTPAGKGKTTTTKHMTGDSEVERDLRKMKTAPQALTERTNRISRSLLDRFGQKVEDRMLDRLADTSASVSTEAKEGNAKAEFLTQPHWLLSPASGRPVSGTSRVPQDQQRNQCGGSRSE